MPIADWFSARETKRYTQVTEQGRQPPAPTCPMASGSSARAASAPSTRASSSQSLRVCPTCGFHFDLTAPQRIEMLADEGSFAEIDADLAPVRPARVHGGQALRGAARRRRREERAARGGHHRHGRRSARARRSLGAMDFRFIGASMGSVVGEKITRAFELATERAAADRARDRVGRRAHAGRHALAHADGQDQRRRPPACRRRTRLRLGAHQPDVRRRHRVVRGARRRRHRRARRAHRLRGSQAGRADHAAEAPQGLPDQRVAHAPRHDRRDRAPRRAQGPRRAAARLPAACATKAGEAS